MTPRQLTARFGAEHFAIGALLLLLSVVVIVWAFWSLPVPTMPASGTMNVPAGPSISRTPAPQVELDLMAFRAPIWVTPPAPAALLPPPPPPPPLRIQLLGIGSDLKGAVCMLFDPDSGAIASVRLGERFANYEIAFIGDDRVECRMGVAVQSLFLRASAPPVPAWLTLQDAASEARSQRPQSSLLPGGPSR